MCYQYKEPNHQIPHTTSDGLLLQGKSHEQLNVISTAY